MARKIFAFASVMAIMILYACPMAAAQAAGWRAEIPVEGLPARLDKVDSGKTLDLIAVADGNYTLSLVPLRMGSDSWVRIVLARGTGFFGMCVLATLEEFSKMEALAVEIGAGGTLRFSALPGHGTLAAFEVPLSLGGECRLLPLAQSQGVTITALPLEEEPATLPAIASTMPEDSLGGPPALRLHPGTYALALFIMALVVAVPVLGNMHWRRIEALAARVKELTVGIWAKLRTRVRNMHEIDAEEQTAGSQSFSGRDTQEIPRLQRGPHLPGLRLTHSGEDALVRQITMRTAWETGLEAAQGNTSEQVNDYFLGRAALPAWGHFRTVGLRNRDALQQLDGRGVRPLFASNPKGQIFSLEEESGGLYLHVDYFAPPSFLLQPVLRSVCLECVFTLEDRSGTLLRLENVLGHAILGIVPARTAHTDSGFIVTEKGRLVIGDS